MKQDKEIEESMQPEGFEAPEVEKENAWTSIDLYYKGFHVKKSIPANISPSFVVDKIEEYIKLGFAPSWNTGTNVANGHPETAEKQDICQHPEDKIEIKIVQSGKNAGKKYARCSLCNAFVRWA